MEKNVKNVKKYYDVYIEDFLSKPYTFTTLREAKKFVIDNYSSHDALIIARLCEDNFSVYGIIYSPNYGFSKLSNK